MTRDYTMYVSQEIYDFAKENNLDTSNYKVIEPMPSHEKTIDTRHYLKLNKTCKRK